MRNSLIRQTRRLPKSLSGVIPCFSCIALELRARLARSSNAMQLKQGITPLSDFGNLLVCRIREFRIAYPNKHSQLRRTRMRKPIRREANAGSEGKLLASFENERLVTRRDMSDILG